MVCAEARDLREVAQEKLALADSALGIYVRVVLDADYSAARQCLRNARNHLRDEHFAAVIRNAERVIDAVNDAVAEAIRERFSCEVGALRTNIEEARRLYRPVPELDVLENSLMSLEQELLDLRPAVVYHRSQPLFAQIPIIAAGLTRCLDTLRLEKLQRDQFEAKAEQISKLFQGMRERYPQANQTELRWFEEELEDTRRRFLKQKPVQILGGSCLRDLANLATDVEGLRVRLSAAFRPPSDKSVPQRGRLRVPTRSSRGPGRHSRRR